MAHGKAVLVQIVFLVGAVVELDSLSVEVEARSSSPKRLTSPSFSSQHTHTLQTTTYSRAIHPYKCERLYFHLRNHVFNPAWLIPRHMI
jgi:hypothetical protein